MKRPWWIALLPAGAVLIRLLGRTLRRTFINREIELELRREGSFILTGWHSRSLYFCYHYRDQTMSVMISGSDDGDIVAPVVEAMGVLAVRGSSSRGGAGAFRQVVRLLKEGWDTAIMPDGPRGPRCRVQPGVIEMARISGAPILPVTFAARHRVVFNSWDRFVLPLPFSRVVVIFDEPMRVGPDDDIEAARLNLEERLNAITQQAEATWGR
ncbi:MAG: lysophospholipid acyltransferase family protein [bacterium]|nr:lysophospholipid acyltransferase family protein [bacterium]